MAKYIDRVMAGSCADYLHDWSLPIHCPDLARQLTIPRRGEWCAHVQRTDTHTYMHTHIHTYTYTHIHPDMKTDMHTDR